MANLKDDTLSHLKNLGKSEDDIEYCFIEEEVDWKNRNTVLKGSFEIDKLNFGYDCGFGGQEIFGFLVYKDGTWSERREYDGSEWWEYFSRPKLP